MKRMRDLKHFPLALTLVIVGAILILFYIIANNIEGFSSLLDKINKILAPFIFGFVMAYLLSPIYNIVVRFFYGKLSKKISRYRSLLIARTMGSFVALAVMIGIIVSIIALLGPQLFDGVMSLYKNLPDHINVLMKWVTNLSNYIGNDAVRNTIEYNVKYGGDKLVLWMKETVISNLDSYTKNLSQGIMLTVSTVINVIVGIIVTIYILNEKETFLGQLRKLILANYSKENSDKIFTFAKYTNKTFSKYINGKILDSFVIGVICFFAMEIIGLPYTVLISVIIGVTNVIPFFGPFIGAIPSTIIIALVNPIYAIYFLIMIFILQQLDGNVIGPFILGGATGLSSFWVMFAIMVGGGLFGFMGMVLGIPVFAITYHYVGKILDRKLFKKGLPTKALDYEDFHVYNIDKNELEKIEKEVIVREDKKAKKKELKILKKRSNRKGQ